MPLRYKNVRIAVLSFAQDDELFKFVSVSSHRIPISKDYVRCGLTLSLTRYAFESITTKKPVTTKKRKLLEENNDLWILLV